MADARIDLIEDCAVVLAAPGQSGIPMSVMTRTLALVGKGSVMDTDLARLHGAILVAGLPRDLERLRLAPETQEAAARLDRQIPHSLPSKARNWAVWGEQGNSSLAVFAALSGIKLQATRDTAAHPLDLADLRRCLLLLEQVPGWMDRCSELASLSPVWERLAPVLADFRMALDAEAPDWRGGRFQAPVTAQTLVHVLDPSVAPGL